MVLAMVRFRKAGTFAGPGWCSDRGDAVAIAEFFSIQQGKISWKIQATSGSSRCSKSSRPGELSTREDPAMAWKARTTAADSAESTAKTGDPGTERMKL